MMFKRSYRCDTQSRWTLCAVLAVATAASSAPALAQASQQQPSQQQALQDASAVEVPQIDPQDVYDRAMQAEWAGEYAQARTLHTQAASLGYARSHYQLGFLLLDGLGGPRDVQAARDHLRQAADGGVTLALVPYLYSHDDQDDGAAAPDAQIAAHALLELAVRDLGMAGDTIQFWSQPMRRQVQVYLQEAGFYRGPIDGLIGNGSLNALRAFARARAPLPELPSQRFEPVVISADGVKSQAQDLFTFARIETLVDARSAFLGARVEDAAMGQWRISTGGHELLYWSYSAVSDDAQMRSIFHLPGKPQRTDFTLGMPLDTVAPSDLGACDLKVLPPEDGGTYQRSCATRVEGVRVVFDAENGPADDLDAQNSQEGAPRGEVLTAIHLTAPLSLRFADSQ